MRAYKIFSLLLTLSLLMAFLPAAQAAPAPQPPAAPPQSPARQDYAQAACSNLDVVFIVDQSDSMSRNDAIANRKYAVEGMVDLLVQMALYDCPGTSHRLSVISFGSEDRTRVDVEMYDINPTTADGGRRIATELRPRVKADNLGQTYPEPAFQEAYRIFNRNALNDGVERKRVIVFITDGLPCAAGQCEGADYNATTASLRALVESRFPFADDLKGREDCLAVLRRDYPDTQPPADKATDCIEKNGVAPASYENSTYIFTLLLHNSDEDYVSSAVSQLEALSHSHAGELFKNQSENQIPTTLRKILSQLMGIRPSLLRGPNFAVNPYLNKMIVTAYKRTADIDFKLSYTDANGKVHTIEGGQPSDGFTLDPNNGYYKFGANETYTILNPYPGIWSMSSTNPNGMDVFYQPIDAKIRQTAPFTQAPQYDREPFYNVDDPTYLEFTLYDDANGGAIVAQAEKTQFAIDVQAVVTDPAGKQVTYSLAWDVAAKSFKSGQPLQVPLAGTYKLVLTGTTHRHEGEPVVDISNEAVVFDKPFTLFKVESEFTGQDVTPVQIEPLTPQVEKNAGSIHATLLNGWPLKVLPLQVRVHLTGEDGSVFADPQKIFKDPAQAMQAQLIYQPEPREGGEESSDETESSVPVFLQPDPAAPGEFIASFPDFEHEGAYKLQVTIDRAQMQDGYWPYRNQTTVAFSRTDCLFCRANTYYVILGLIIAFIAALIAYNILIRTNKVAGTLYFKDGSIVLAEFGLYNGTNFRNIGRRELNSYPHLGLKRFTVKNTGKRKRNAQQQDAVTGGYYGEESLGVTVDYVTLDGRRAQVNLDPGFPVNYSEETIAQMVYEPAE
ncbi:MAG: hypothetical protein Fur0035_06710 [Anaerolineales bacterium]